MWSRITGNKNNDVEDDESYSSRRSAEYGRSSRRAPKSSTSSKPTRKQSRDETHDRGFNPTSTSYTSTTRSPYPGTASASIASSYATAGSSQIDGSSLPPSVLRNRSIADNMPITKPGREEKDQEYARNRKSERRRERSSSRDRERDVETGDRKDRRTEKRDKRYSEYGGRESDTRPRRPGTGFSDNYGRTEETSRGIFDEQIGGHGFTQFPGQYDGSLPGSSNGLSRPTHMSDHVPDQFPGQFPTQSSAPYRPPISSSEGGPGLASEYYNDNGESVSRQPGVRPQPPTLIIGAEPHLHAAAPVAAPPPEPSFTDGVGAAASFYNGIDDLPSASSIKPASSSRPAKETASGKDNNSGLYSSSVAAMGGATVGYATGAAGPNNRPQSSANGQIYHQQIHNVPFPDAHQSSSVPNQNYNHSASAPILPTLGVAAAGAAAGYIIGEHTSSHAQSPGNIESTVGRPSGAAAPNYGRPPSYSGAYQESVTPYSESTKPGKPPLESFNSSVYVAGAASAAAAAYHHNNHSSGYLSSTGKQYSSGHTAQRHRHHGPLGKFVDFWKDPDGVAQFEEYTEYIGVCKYCFAPGSSPRDAPRKHHYRKRRSNERLGSTTRVDKDSRYWSSDSEGRRRKKSSWLTTGLAGYGLVKVGESLFNQKNGSGEFYGLSPGHAKQSREFLHSPDERSSVSYGVTRRSSNIGSCDRIKTGITSDGKVYKRGSRGSSIGGPTTTTYETRQSTKNGPRSRSRSRDRKSGLAEAALSAALGTSVASSSMKFRQESPEKAHSKPTPRIGERSPRRDGRSYHSPSPSYVDLKSSRREEAGFFGGFFGPQGHKHHKNSKKPKKDRGFFSFSNASSSSSDSPQAFSGKHDRQKRSKKPRGQDNDQRKAEAAILGIGAVAATIAAKESRKNHNSRAKADLVAVRETKGRHAHKSRENRTKQSANSSSSSEDQWESATEDDYYSADSALAYGLSRRKSRDSSNSESSGTNKWGWRWGSRKKKRNVIESPRRNDNPIIAGIGTSVLAGTAVDAPFANDIHHYENSMDSLIGAPLRNVYPIATADPTRYDADNQSSMVSSNFPIMASQPAPIPLQQPQPVIPISSAVYGPQPIYGHSYSAPSGHPIFTQQFSQPQAPANEKYGGVIKDVNMPSSFHTSERPTGSSVRDIPKEQKVPRPNTPPSRSNGHESRSSRQEPYRDEPASIRFDLSKERQDQDRRQKRRERKAEEDRLKWSELRQAEEQIEMAKAGRATPDRPSRDIDKIEDLDRIFNPNGSDEKKSRQESQTSWVAPVAAATAATAATVSATNGRVESTRGDQQGIGKQNETRRDLKQNHEESAGISVEDFDAANRQAKIIRQAAAKVRKPASPVHESYAAYFVPPNLPSKAKEKAQSSQRFDDDVTSSYPVAEIVTIEPRSRFPNPPDFDYAEDKDLVVDLDTVKLSWIVPNLHLIDPTPPNSYAGSIRSNASPIIQPKDVHVAEEKQPVRPRTGSKVTWDDDKTHEYTMITPLESCEGIIDEEKLASHRNEDQTQSVEGVEDHGQNQPAEPGMAETGHIPGEFGDDLEFAATLAAGLEDTGFNPSIVIDDPIFRRRESPPRSERATFHISPFAETVTDLGLDSPGTEGAPPQQGFIEGELPSTPEEEIEHPMPGTFDEDPKTSVGQERMDQIDETAKGEHEGEDPMKIKRVVPRTEDVPEEPEEWVTSSKKKKSKSKKSSKRDDKIVAASPRTLMDDGDKYLESTAEPTAFQESYEPRDGHDIEDVMAKALEMKSLGDNSSTFGQRSDLDADKASDNFERSLVRGLSQPPPEDVDMTAAYDLSQEDDGDRKRPNKEPKDGNDIVDDVASATVAAAVESRKGSKSKSKKDKRGDLRGMSSKSIQSISDLGRSEDSTKETSFRDFEEPKRKNKKSKDRYSARNEQDGSSPVSLIGNDPSKIYEQDEIYGYSRKSKDKKKRQNRESGLQDEIGRSAHDLPAKVYTPASLGPFDKCIQEKLLTNAKDLEVTQSENNVGDGSEYLIVQDRAKFTDSNEPLSFLGQRQEILKPPDGPNPLELSTNQAEHARITSVSTVDEQASPDQDRSASQGPPVSPVVVNDADDLPPLPASRPDSPTAPLCIQTRRPSTSKSAESPQRGGTYSPTAIPFHFRKPPASPGLARTSSTGFPVSSSPSSVAFGIRPKSRPTSTEFKSNEFRPLWLVERHSLREEPLPGEFPSLPSSHTTSRSSSVHDGDEIQVHSETENAVYVEDNSAPGEVAEMSLNTTHTNVPPDLLGSQQTTPTAASLHSPPARDGTTQDHSLLSAGAFVHIPLAEHKQPLSSSRDQDLNAEEQSNLFQGDKTIDEKVDSHQEASKGLHDGTGADFLAESYSPRTVIPQDRSDSAPTIGVAAIGAAIRAAAAVLTSSKDSGNHAIEPVERTLVPETEHGLKPADDETISSSPALQRVISSIDPFDDSATSDKAGITHEEMGQSRDKIAQAGSRFATEPPMMSAEERRQIEENDTQDAVESWFAPASSKKVKKDKKGNDVVLAQQEARTSDNFEDETSSKIFSSKTKKSKAKKGRKKSTNTWDENIGGLATTETINADDGTDPATLEESIQTLQQTTQADVVDPLAADSERGLGEDALLPDTQAQEAYFTPSKKSKKGRKKNKQSLTRTESYDDSYEDHSVRDKALSNRDLLSQVPQLVEGPPVAIDSPTPAEGSLIGSVIAAATLPLLLSTSADKETSDEQQSNPADGSSPRNALDPSAGFHGPRFQEAPLGEEDLPVGQSFEHDVNANEVTNHREKAVVSTIPDQPPKPESLASTSHCPTRELAGLSTAPPSSSRDVDIHEQLETQHAATLTDSDSKDPPALTRFVGFPEDTPLPAGDDLDLLDALPESPIIIPDRSQLRIEEQTNIGDTTRDEDRGNLLDPTVSPELTPLPTSNDLDLLDALLESPATLPEQTHLPPSDDLNLLDALPGSPTILKDFSELPNEESFDARSVARDNAHTDRAKLSTIVVSPEQTPLPTGDDLDSLDAQPESPIQLPNYANIPTEKELDTRSTGKDHPLEARKEPVNLAMSPEQTPLPISDDLDLNYPEFETQKELGIRRIGNDHPIEAREELVNLVIPLEQTPLPFSDDRDLLDALPGNPITLPEYSKVPAKIEFEQEGTVEGADIKDVHLPADFPISPEELPLRTEDDLNLPDPVPESQWTGPNHSGLQPNDTYYSVKAAESSDRDILLTPVDNVTPPEQMPLPVGDESDLSYPVPVMQPDNLDTKFVNRFPETSREISVDPHSSPKILPLKPNVDSLPSLIPVDLEESVNRSVGQLVITPMQESKGLPTENDMPNNTEPPFMAIDRTSNDPQAADVADEFFSITSKRKKKDKKSHRSQSATPAIQEDAEDMREIVFSAAVDKEMNPAKNTAGVPSISEMTEQAQEEECALPSQKKDKKGKKQKPGNSPPQSFDAERGSTLEPVAVLASKDPSTTSESRAETPLQLDREVEWAPRAKRKGKKQNINHFQAESSAGSPGEEFGPASPSTKDSQSAILENEKDTLVTPTEQAPEDLRAIPAKKKGKKGKKQTSTRRELSEMPETPVEPTEERGDVHEAIKPIVVKPTRVEPIPKALLESGVYERSGDALESGSPKSVSEALQDPEPSLSAVVPGTSESFGKESRHEPIAVTDTAHEIIDLLSESTGHASPPNVDAETLDPELLLKPDDTDDLELAPGESFGVHRRDIAPEDIHQERDDAESLEAEAAPEDHKAMSTATPQAAIDTAKDVEDILTYPDHKISPIRTPQESSIAVSSLPATEELTHADCKVPIDQSPNEDSQALDNFPSEGRGSRSHKVRDFKLSDSDLPSWSIGEEMDGQTEQPKSDDKVPISAHPSVSRARDVNQLLDAARINLPEDESDDFNEAVSEMQTESLESKRVPEFPRLENNLDQLLDATQISLPEDEMNDFPKAMAEKQTESSQSKHVAQFSRLENDKNTKIAADADTNPAQPEGSLIRDFSSTPSFIAEKSPEIYTLSKDVGRHGNQDTLEAEMSFDSNMIAQSAVVPDQSLSTRDEPLKSLEERQKTRHSSEETLIPTSSTAEGDKENAVEAEGSAWDGEASLGVPEPNADNGSREVQPDSTHNPLALLVLPPVSGEASVLSTRNQENAEEALKSSLLDDTERSVPPPEAIESSTVPEVLQGSMPTTDTGHMKDKSGVQDKANAIDEREVWSDATHELSGTQPVEDFKVLREVEEKDPASTELLGRPETIATSEHDVGADVVNIFNPRKENKGAEKHELSALPEEPTSIPDPIMPTDLIIQKPDTSAEKDAPGLRISDEVVHAVSATNDRQTPDEPGMPYSLKKTKKDKMKAKKAQDVEWLEESPAAQALVPSAESITRDSVAMGEESSMGRIDVDPVLPDVILISDAEAVAPDFQLKKSKKDKKKAQKAQQFIWPEKSPSLQELTPSAGYAPQDSVVPGKDSLQELPKFDEHRPPQAEGAEPENNPVDSSFSLKKTKKDKKKGKKVRASDWSEDSPPLQDTMQPAEVGPQEPTTFSEEASRNLSDLYTSKNLPEGVQAGAEADPIESVLSLKKGKKDKKKGKKPQTSDWSDVAPSTQSPAVKGDLATKESMMVGEEPSNELVDVDEHEQIPQDKQRESNSDPVEPSFDLKKSKKDKKKAKKAENVDWPQDSSSLPDPSLPAVNFTQEPAIVSETSKDPADTSELHSTPQIASRYPEVDPLESSFNVKKSKKDKKKTKKGQPFDWAGTDTQEEGPNTPAENPSYEDITRPLEKNEEGASISHDLESGVYDISMAKGFETQATPSFVPSPVKNIPTSSERLEPGPTTSTEDYQNKQTSKDLTVSAASDKKVRETFEDLPLDPPTVSTPKSLPPNFDYPRNVAQEPSQTTEQSAEVQKDDMTLGAATSHEADSQFARVENIEQSLVGDCNWDVSDGESLTSKEQRKNTLDSVESSTIEAGHQVAKGSESYPVNYPLLVQEMATTGRSVGIDAEDEAASPKAPHGTALPTYHNYPSIENVNDGVRDAMISEPQELATRLAISKSSSTQPTYHNQEVGHVSTPPEFMERTLHDHSRLKPQLAPHVEDHTLQNEGSEISNSPHNGHVKSVLEVVGKSVEEPNTRPIFYFPESDINFEEPLQSTHNEPILPSEPITVEQASAAHQNDNVISEAAEPVNTRVASEDYMAFPTTKKSKKGQKGKKQQGPVIWEDETATPPMRTEASTAEGKAGRGPVTEAFVDPTARRTPEADLTLARQDLESYGSGLRSVSPSSRVEGHDKLAEEGVDEGNSWNSPSQVGGSLERTLSATLLPSLPHQKILGEDHQGGLVQPTSSYQDQSQDYFSFDPEPLAQQDTLEATELEAARQTGAIVTMGSDPMIPLSTAISEKDAKESKASADTPIPPIELSAHIAGIGQNDINLLEQETERPSHRILPSTHDEDTSLEMQSEHEHDIPSTKKSKKPKKSKKQKFDYEGPGSLSSSGLFSKPQEVSSQDIVITPKFGSGAVSQEHLIAASKHGEHSRAFAGERGDGGSWGTNDAVAAATVAGLGTGLAIASDLVGEKSEKAVKKNKKSKKDKTKNAWTAFEGQDNPEPMVQEEQVEMPQEVLDDKLPEGQTNTAAWKEDQPLSHTSQEVPTDYDVTSQGLDLDRIAYPGQDIADENDPYLVSHRAGPYTGNTSPNVDMTYHPMPANDESDINRDSALHISDSPLVSYAPSTHHAVRDSGYQDTEASPIIGHEYTLAAAKNQYDNRALQQSIPEESQGPEAIHQRRSLSHSPVYDQRKDTFNVSVEADSDYDISLSRPTSKRGRPRTASRKTQSHQDNYILPKQEFEPEYNDRLLASIGEDLRQPSPVDSTTRDRSSMLFQSSQPTREDSALQGAAHTAVTPIEEAGQATPRQIHEEPPFQEPPTPIDPSVLADRAASLAALSGVGKPTEQEHHSLFGGPAGVSSDMISPPRTPFSPDGSSCRRLNAIPEYSPEESPLHKHSRTLSDVGSPDRGHKSARRTSTPQALAHSRVRSPLAAASTPRKKSLISTDDIISSLDWPTVDDEKHSVDLNRSRSISRNTNPHRPLSCQSNLSPLTADPAKHRDTERRSVSGASVASVESINAIIRTPDQVRSVSGLSQRSSGTPPLRRVDRSVSSDLRAANKRSEAKRQAKLNLAEAEPQIVVPSSSTYDPVKDKGKTRARGMADVYVSANDKRSSLSTPDPDLVILQEGYGDVHSPLSPTRPPSVRRMQSMQMLQLEQRLDSLISENRLLQDAKSRAERSLEDIDHERSQERSAYTEAILTRDVYVQQKDAELSELRRILEGLHGEVSRLTEINEGFVASRGGIEEHEQKYSELEAEHANTHQQWQQSQRELEDLREQHKNLSGGMEEIVRHEIAVALEGKNTELRALREELEAAKEQVRVLQKQILASKPSDDFLINRDEDYFENRCQQLCHSVQQWIVRFSKFSDMKPCLLSSDIADEKITDRFDNAILDGSDVDTYLADRVKRRDVFMSVVMTMIFEYIFTRYLFGMDREQRQKLKSLEKTLSEVGPMSAVHKWRATTLTLLSKHETFLNQRTEDTEAVVHEIYSTLATFLPPPPHLVSQVQDSLRNVMRLAVDLSIEMRTQRSEYIMLPPLQPEYDTNGDLARKVYFNASLMNERSGNTDSNEELQEKRAVVRMVLFPLVVKKDEMEGEVVVCPAQVLCKGKGKRVGWEKGSAVGSVGGQVGE